MIAVAIKHFYNIIFMSYHSFILIMNTNYFVLNHAGIY